MKIKNSFLSVLVILLFLLPLFSSSQDCQNISDSIIRIRTDNYLGRPSFKIFNKRRSPLYVKYDALEREKMECSCLLSKIWKFEPITEEEKTACKVLEAERDRILVNIKNELEQVQSDLNNPSLSPTNRRLAEKRIFQIKEAMAIVEYECAKDKKEIVIQTGHKKDELRLKRRIDEIEREQKKIFREVNRGQ